MNTWQSLAAAIAVTALFDGLVVLPLIIWASHKWPNRGSEGHYNPYLDGV